MDRKPDWSASHTLTQEVVAVLEAARTSSPSDPSIEPVDVLFALVTIGQGVADDVRWSVGWTVEDGP